MDRPSWPQRRITPPLRHVDRFAFVHRPEDYAGQAWVTIWPTQLEDDEARTATLKRRFLQNWIEFLSEGTAPITHLSISSRTPQALLDAVAGISTLEYLFVKWGPYADLSALSGLHRLQALELGGGGRITTLSPLMHLPALTELHIDGAFRHEEVNELSGFTGLRFLEYGSGSLGTDRMLHVSHLRWTQPLQNLRWLSMPGTIIDDGDLSPLAALPELSVLNFPLRKREWPQLRQIASASPALGRLEQEYSGFFGGPSTRPL